MIKIMNFNILENYLKMYIKIKKSDVVFRVKFYVQIVGINLFDIVFYGEFYFLLLLDFIVWVSFLV